MTGPDEGAADSDASRLLVATYGLFTVAAGSRSAYQISTGFDEAPLAFVLSALAASIYALACLALATHRWTLARLCCAIELAGVLAIGSWSVLAPATFPRATVWSRYGAGYACFPLLLPVAGLAYLAWRRRHTAATRAQAEPSRHPG